MNFDIPKISKEIALADYAPEFGEQTIKVWVNPPREIIDRINTTIQNFEAEKSDSYIDLIAALWDWPAEDVVRLLNHSFETDPALFPWCVFKTFGMIKDHRSLLKKNWNSL